MNSLAKVLEDSECNHFWSLLKDVHLLDGVVGVGQSGSVDLLMFGLVREGAWLLVGRHSVVKPSFVHLVVPFSIAHSSEIHLLLEVRPTLRRESLYVEASSRCARRYSEPDTLLAFV